MSDSELDVFDQDVQMAFVYLLEEHKILFDKRQNPIVKVKKEKAAETLADTYSKLTQKDMNVKQVMKKFNNMKTKVRTAAKRLHTGRVTLSEWQKKFLELWNDVKNFHHIDILTDDLETDEVIHISPQRIPSPPPVPSTTRRKFDYNEEPDEFRYKSMEDLQRICLLQQIKTARAQEQAAKEMEEYYKKQNMNTSVIGEIYHMLRLTYMTDAARNPKRRKDFDSNNPS